MNGRHGILRTMIGACILACFFSLPIARTVAQAAPASEQTVPALLVSDIHFEPFWDPAKVSQLVAAPIRQWDAIFAASPSPDREQRFTSLQQSCHARGVDSSYALFASSLRAMQIHAAGAKFVTVSGDLLSHNFSCKYSTLFPQPAPSAYRAFVEKTLDYVLGELRGVFPGVPVFAALGNNDSDCDDYRLDPHSSFLADIAKRVVAGYSSSASKAALETFTAGGYYSAALPAPLRHARLLVLDDIFMSNHYQTCGGKSDSTAARLQISWLRQQLALARRNGEKVWVMGHIPLGIDPYSTLSKMKSVCDGKSAETFLSSDELAITLTEFGDVIQLAIFAHTHMDELRLLKPPPDASHPATRPGVAIKMVPSISPINGNSPSFTVARIDPSSAVMSDYEVISVSNQSGADIAWTEEYDFADTYHQPAFSASSLEKLIAGFRADPLAEAPASQSYLRYYFVRDRSVELRLFWSQYVCALSSQPVN